MAVVYSESTETMKFVWVNDHLTAGKAEEVAVKNWLFKLHELEHECVLRIDLPDPRDPSWSGVYVAQIGAYLLKCPFVVFVCGSIISSLARNSYVLPLTNVYASTSVEPIYNGKHLSFALPIAWTENPMSAIENLIDMFPFETVGGEIASLTEGPLLLESEPDNEEVLWSVRATENNQIETIWLTPGGPPRSRFDKTPIGIFYLYPPVTNVFFEFEDKFPDALGGGDVDEEALILHYGCVEPVSASKIRLPWNRFNDLRNWAKNRNFLLFYTNAMSPSQQLLRNKGWRIGRCPLVHDKEAITTVPWIAVSIDAVWTNETYPKLLKISVVDQDDKLSTYTTCADFLQEHKNSSQIVVTLDPQTHKLLGLWMELDNQQFNDQLCTPFDWFVVRWDLFTAMKDRKLFKYTSPTWTLTAALEAEKIPFDEPKEWLDKEIHATPIDMSPKRAQFLAQLVRAHHVVEDVLSDGALMGCISFVDLQTVGQIKRILSCWFTGPFEMKHAFPVSSVDSEKYEGGFIDLNDGLPSNLVTDVVSLDMKSAYATIIVRDKVCPTLYDPATSSWMRPSKEFPVGVVPYFIGKLIEMRQKVEAGSSWSRVLKLTANTFYGYYGLCMTAMASVITEACRKAIKEIRAAYESRYMVILVQTDGIMIKARGSAGGAIKLIARQMSEKLGIQIGIDNVYQAMIVVNKTTTSSLKSDGTIVCTGCVCKKASYPAVARRAEHVLCEALLHSTALDSSAVNVLDLWNQAMYALDTAPLTDFSVIHKIKPKSVQFVKEYIASHLESPWKYSLVGAIETVRVYSFESSSVCDMSMHLTETHPFSLLKNLICDHYMRSACLPILGKSASGILTE